MAIGTVISWFTFKIVWYTHSQAGSDQSPLLLDSYTIDHCIYVSLDSSLKQKEYSALGTTSSGP